MTQQTEQLALLIERKHICLTEFRQLCERQRQLVGEGELTQLFKVLAAKQHLVAHLHSLEQALMPFRATNRSSADWATPEQRADCAAKIDQCQQLYGEIQQLEKECQHMMQQRRDQLAGQLEGVHAASQTRQAYGQQMESTTGYLDLTSET